MSLIDVVSSMNSNFENRKHGGYSKIGRMQEDLFNDFPEVGLENIFSEEFYFPIGEKIEVGSLESLKKATTAYSASNTLSGSKKLG